MRAFLRFIIKYHFVIIFAILEIIAYVLVINNNNYQQASFLNLAQVVTGKITKEADDWGQYLALKEVNQQLSLENQSLRNQLENCIAFQKTLPPKYVDTTKHKTYEYLVAKVINNSINKQYNYITIDKGSKDGIVPEMGVISEEGVVGVIQSVTENYSLAISLLNRNLRVSAKFKKHNYFGSFQWSGNNYLEGSLNDIPFHVKMVKGDTIVTSGFSTIFPEGIRLGYVAEFESGNGNFFDISLKLSTDFKNLSYVYVVRNLKKAERESIEKLVKE
jgi:rod shape-determining protein MreC